MRMLYLGDIVGRTGRRAVCEQLPALRERWKLDAIVVNAENSAGGFGLTEAIHDELVASGADAVTLGNHSFDQRETLVFIERAPQLVRPANYPPGTPGRGATLVEVTSGRRLLVIQVMGRIYMETLDDPFAALERELAACPLGAGCDAIIVDIHAEATSEKQCIGWFADGRASLVAGTHTHVPTSDHRILPGGTAYISDLGMCGDYEGVLGMDRHEPLRRFIEKTPGNRLEPAQGPSTICGIAVETDDVTGLALKVAPVRLGGSLSQAAPDFW